MKLWDFIGAVVWAPCSEDCYDCEEPRYGPHVKEGRDRTGHHAEIEILVNQEHPKGWPIAVCECGFRDFPPNYYDHLEAVAPMVLVYS